MHVDNNKRKLKIFLLIMNLYVVFYKGLPNSTCTPFSVKLCMSHTCKGDKNELLLIL